MNQNLSNTFWANDSQFEKYKARKKLLSKRYRFSIFVMMILIITTNWTWQKVRHTNTLLYRHRLERKGPFGWNFFGLGNLKIKLRIPVKSTFYPGSVCGKGFVPTNETCADFDECLKESPTKVKLLSQGYVSCGVGATCSNNIGGYACVCKYGFEANITKPGKTAFIYI